MTDSAGHLIAEVISIGDELTTGQRLDTNSQWVSQQLGELGVTTVYHTTVADDLAANLAVFRAAVERADIVIATGGLGPTADDLTREVLAVVSGSPLQLREDILEQIRSLFTRRAREMPERNHVQALFPEVANVIANPHGTAPGVDIVIARNTASGAARVFALPGVPAEMEEMWNLSVAPEIVAMQGATRPVIVTRVLKIFGAGESEVERMLPDMIRRGHVPTVGITASKATISLRMVAKALSHEVCNTQIETAEKTIRECLKSLIYGEAEEELQDVVLRELAKRRLTLSFCDWGSGGMLGHWLATAAQTHPGVLRGGILIHNRAMLARMMPKSDVAATQHGLFSEEFAGALAQETRAQLDTDLALALGPFPELDISPPLPFAFAVASANQCLAKTAAHAGHPEFVVQRNCKASMNLLRLELSAGRLP
jgi:nicotinamide-nucleotide amidase